MNVYLISTMLLNLLLQKRTMQWFQVWSLEPGHLRSHLGSICQVCDLWQAGINIPEAQFPHLQMRTISLMGLL